MAKGKALVGIGAAVGLGLLLLLPKKASAAEEDLPPLPPAPVDTGYSEEVIENVQEQLNVLLAEAGYILLKVDGVVGPKTCGALRWAAQIGLLDEGTAGAGILAECSDFEEPYAPDIATSDMIREAQAWARQWVADVGTSGVFSSELCNALETAFYEATLDGVEPPEAAYAVRGNC